MSQMSLNSSHLSALFPNVTTEMENTKEAIRYCLGDLFLLSLPWLPMLLSLSALLLPPWLLSPSPLLLLQLYLSLYHKCGCCSCHHYHNGHPLCPHSCHWCICCQLFCSCHFCIAVTAHCYCGCHHCHRCICCCLPIMRIVVFLAQYVYGNYK